MNTVFYISAAVAIFSTLMVITRLNAVHALLYLIVSFFSVALIFLVLGAAFVAALEIIIYAGAIMVLFVFVIMMLNLGPRAQEQESQWLKPKMWIGPVASGGHSRSGVDLSDCGFRTDGADRVGSDSETGWDCSLRPLSTRGRTCVYAAYGRPRRRVSSRPTVRPFGSDN